MSTDTLNTIANWVVLSAVPAPLLFAVFYSRSAWRITQVGRALMYQALALATVLVIVVLSLFLGHDYPGRAFIRLVGYIGMSITLWRMFVTLIAYQRADHEDEPNVFAVFRRRKHTRPPEE